MMLCNDNNVKCIEIGENEFFCTTLKAHLIGSESMRSTFFILTNLSAFLFCPNLLTSSVAVGKETVWALSVSPSC